MSVVWGGPEVVGKCSNRANDSDSDVKQGGKALLRSLGSAARYLMRGEPVTAMRITLVAPTKLSELVKAPRCSGSSTLLTVIPRGCCCVKPGLG
jgi:hypothetical protein